MEEKRRFFIIAIVCVVVTILYCVLPIDLIPDFITGIGWLDDLIFGAIGFIGSVVSFFIGLGTGLHLSKVREDLIVNVKNTRIAISKEAALKIMV